MLSVLFSSCLVFFKQTEKSSKFLVTTMLSLLMMPLLIFCVTAENQIEPQASQKLKVW